MPKHTKASHRAYLASDHWQQTRRQRIEEGTGACERCEIPRWLAELVYGQDLHVHHLHYRTKGAEQYEDLEVLCARCHEIETFGRSEFRAPKTATCEVCKDVHWDYRSPLCKICELLSGQNADLNRRLLFLNPDGQEPTWLQFFRELDILTSWGCIDLELLGGASRYLVLPPETIAKIVADLERMANEEVPF